MVEGVRRGDFWILSHGGYEPDFEEISAELLAALPDEPQPPERQAVEEARRAANRMAIARHATGIADMVANRDSAAEGEPPGD